VEDRPTMDALVVAADAGPAALADLIAATTPQWLTEIAALCVGDFREWVPALLDRGADPTAPLIYGGTLLAHAIVKNDVATVTEFLRRGFDINVRTAALPYTPLMHAAACGSRGVLELLLEAGADVNAVATDGTTALSLALRRGEGDPIVSVLRPLVREAD
jgi:ankyrin repeat protein